MIRFLVATLLLISWGTPARAVTTSEMAAEVSRPQREGNRLVNFWWLPYEYWVAAARELKKPSSVIDETRELFRNYVVIAVIDTEVTPEGKLDPKMPSDIGPKLEIFRGDVKVPVLHRIDPRVAELIPELSYFLQTSLAIMNPALRIFFAPNVDEQGQPLLQATKSGRLKLRYSPGDGREPMEFFWRAPLTSLVGTTPCPETGEPLESHFQFCPWHGTKIER